MTTRHTLLAALVLAAATGCSRSESAPAADKTAAPPIDAPVPDAASAEAAELRRIAAELAKLGVKIDVSRIKSKRVGLDEATRFLDAQQDRLFARNHFAAFHTVGTALAIPSGADGADLRKQTVAMLTRTFAGVYDWVDDTMMLLDTDIAKLSTKDAVLGHELVHAFQDQTWDLGRMAKTRTVDQLKVLQCLIEGHAELVSTAMLLARSGKGLDTMSPATFDNALGRLSLAEAAQAHYQLGLALMLRAHRAGKLRLNRATWPRIPPSTEQIIHPAKYGVDNPTAVTLPAWPSRAPFATRLAEDTYGELLLYVLLLQVADDPGRAYVAATGWDGDRLRVYKTAGGNALMWRLVFDRDKDAKQVMALLGKGSPASVKRRGRVVNIAYARDARLQRILAEAFVRHPSNPAADPTDAITTAAAEAAWAAADSASPTVQGNTWVHPALGLRVPVLPGWELLKHQGRPLLAKSVDGRLTHTIVVMALPDPINTTLDALLAESKKILGRLPAVNMVRSQRITIDGVAALLIRVEGRAPQATTDMVTTSVTYRRGERWVQVIVSVDKRQWKRSESDVQRIVSGIRLN